MFGSPGGFVLAYLAPLPLLMVGPRPRSGGGRDRRRRPACAGVGLLGGITSAGVYGGMHAFPSWLLVRQALTRTSGHGDRRRGGIRWDRCCAGSPSSARPSRSRPCSPGAARPASRKSVKTLLETALSMAAPTLAEADRQTFASYLAPMFIGMTAVTWLLMMTVNGVLGQGLLSRRGWALRPTPRWSELTLPDWMSWLLVGAAAVDRVRLRRRGILGAQSSDHLRRPVLFPGLGGGPYPDPAVSGARILYWRRSTSRWCFFCCSSAWPWRDWA